jgi:uncharacterized protein YdeI (YjbR/CyaY-like superfamily)
MTKKAPELPVLTCESRADWEAWLEANHATAPGVWLTFAKKGSKAIAVSRADALEVALCYGWIDSQARSVNEEFWQQRFTPRTRRSKWSQINCAAVEQLIEAGMMKPSGLEQVELARQDGRWDAAYAPPRTMQVPEDLQSKLDANPAAREFFEQLDSQNRYAILFRIHDAKRPETRARRIDKFVAMLLDRQTIH